ncbi:hypothetical protein F5146DRAFT_1006707 [Armillaria mellea]|nr:hypothetical protein F5146DRAFT_1006707 [Armillaria mellea]
MPLMQYLIGPDACTVDSASTILVLYNYHYLHCYTMKMKRNLINLEVRCATSKTGLAPLTLTTIINLQPRMDGVTFSPAHNPDFQEALFMMRETNPKGGNESTCGGNVQAKWCSCKGFSFEADSWQAKSKREDQCRICDELAMRRCSRSQGHYFMASMRGQPQPNLMDRSHDLPKLISSSYRWFKLDCHPGRCLVEGSPTSWRREIYINLEYKGLDPFATAGGPTKVAAFLSNIECNLKTKSKIDAEKEEFQLHGALTVERLLG